MPNIREKHNKYRVRLHCSEINKCVCEECKKDCYRDYSCISIRDVIKIIFKSLEEKGQYRYAAGEICRVSDITEAEQRRVTNMLDKYYKELSNGNK
jgi:uncharacterized protein with ParB-like and HNH nuclease domain